MPRWSLSVRTFTEAEVEALCPCTVQTASFSPRPAEADAGATAPPIASNARTRTSFRLPGRISVDRNPARRQRERLSRQSRGFKGLGRIGIHVHPGFLATPDGPDLSE